MSPEILKLENISKVYKDVEAVRGVSFSVNAGEIVGLLGPNGAGKTTTITMILGLLTPTSGTIKIFSKDFEKNRGEIHEKMNFAAVYAQLPSNLSVSQNLFIFGNLYGVLNLKKRIQETLQDFDLEQYKDTRCGLLSSGEQSRLNLAKALINNPKLLLLDEPTASLDPSASQIIRTRIRDYAKENQAGILWTSHDMNEITQVCGRVLFISHGKILLEGDPKTLPGQYGKQNLEELFIAVAREPLSLE